MSIWIVVLVALFVGILGAGLVLLGRRMWLDHLRMNQMEVGLQQALGWINAQIQAAQPKAEEPDKKLKSVK